MQNAPNVQQTDCRNIGQPSDLERFEVSVRSGTAAVREALQQILQALQPLALDREEAITVELVLAEALNNVVEHAYPDPTSEGPIQIKCWQQADGLHFCVKDSGKAMPGGQAPIGELQQNDVAIEDLPEGGFGWFLIRDLAKDVQYARVGGGNQLNLRIAVAYGQPN